MRAWCVLVCSLAGLAVTASSARAQATAGRPYRSLFGGDGTGRPSHHQVNLTLTFNGATDNNAFTAPADGTGGDSTSGFSELYAATAQLAYALTESRGAVNVSAGASYPYYSTLADQADTLAYGASASASYSPGRTSVSAFGRYFFSPYYSALFSPTYVPPPDGAYDYATAASPNELLTGGASLTRQVSRNTSLNASYFLSGHRFTEEGRSNGSQGVRASVSGRATRNLSLNGGYAYSSSRYTQSGVETPSWSQSVDGGVGYARQWSASTMTSFDASLAWSTVDYAERRTDRWGGSVGVSQAIGSRWSIGGRYGRSLQHLSVTTEPVWTDNVSATVAGRFGTRVSLSAGAAYSSGERVSGGIERYSSYSANAGLQFALATFAAMSVSYVYYRYDYPAGYDLPPGMSQQFDRHRVQAGATFWLPILRSGPAPAPRGSAGQ